MLTIPALLASENYKVASRRNVISGVLLINTPLSNGRNVPGGDVRGMVSLIDFEVPTGFCWLRISSFF